MMPGLPVSTLSRAAGNEVGVRGPARPPVTPQEVPSARGSIPSCHRSMHSIQAGRLTCRRRFDLAEQRHRRHDEAALVSAALGLVGKDQEQLLEADQGVGFHGRNVSRGIAAVARIVAGGIR